MKCAAKRNGKDSRKKERNSHVLKVPTPSHNSKCSASFSIYQCQSEMGITLQGIDIKRAT